MDATKPAPFAAGEGGAPDYPCKLFYRIPRACLLALDQQDKHGLNLLKPLFQHHGRTLPFKLPLHEAFRRSLMSRRSLEDFLECTFAQSVLPSPFKRGIP